MRRSTRLVTLFYFTLFALFFNLQCKSDYDEGQPPVPDVSQIKVEHRIQRFDRDLFAMDTAHFAASMAALQQKYPAFVPFFIREIAHDPNDLHETPEQALYGFVTAPQVRRINDSCQVKFPNLDQFQKDGAQVLRYFKYYFPQRPVPTTVTAVTEFIGDAHLVNDSTMMIGLDLFLGEKFEGYNPEIFPMYLLRQFTPDNMVIKYAFELANRIIPPPAQDHVLDHMVRNGKVLYILDCLLPTVPDSLKMNYSRAEYEGSLANESDVWARLLDMKVLYEPLNSKNMKIVTAGPSTDNVFQEAPGQIGNWIGWQITKAYMKRYPQTGLEELGKMTDAQKYLEKAKYKPRKR